MQGISPQCFLHFPTFGYRDWRKEFLRIGVECAGLVVLVI
jgi:hypothetical protein